MKKYSFDKLVKDGFITNLTITEKSVASVKDAYYKKHINDLTKYDDLLKDEAIVDTPEEINKELDSDKTDLNVTCVLQEDAKLELKNDDTYISFAEKQDKKIVLDSKKDADIKNAELVMVNGAADVDIKLPNATVTLDGGVYEKVNASVADYTLVLEPGVVVNNLNVVSGNVLVKEGAVIKAITRDSSNKNVVIVYTDGNPRYFDIPAAVESVTENVWYKVSEVLSRGGKMVLDDDAKLSPMSSSEFYGELDLNGHTLSVNGMMNSAVVKAGKSLKIYNGLIRTTGYVKQEAVFKVTANSTLSFDKVDFNTEGSGIFANGEKAHVIVKDSIFNSFYAIATNASVPVPKHMTIDLKDSSFTGMSTVFVNVPCDLNITNCEINGQMHGVIVRGGNANISNSTINMDYKDSDFEAMASYFDSRDWASGNTINLAGLVMGNKNTTAYKYPTSVKLVNTKVSVLGHADLFPPVYAWAYDYPVTFDYDEACVFNGQLGAVYGNNGHNITVNGVSKEA